jgi:hypothetical protein
VSVFVNGDLGRYRAVSDGTWLFECRCGEWVRLSNDQWLGLISADHASMGCPVGYHETHSYAADLEAHIDAQVVE